MKTITSSQEFNLQIEKSQSNSESGIFGVSWETLKFNYYSVIVMTLLVGSCVGAIAAALILDNDAPIWQLAVCATLTMFNNTTAIGSMPVKWVIYSSIIALIGNVILIGINL
jgi:hypothetical protein